MSGSADWIEIRPLRGPLRATLELPGSKSLTNRALVIGALADGECRLLGALDSDDTRYMAGALERLGFELSWQRAAREIRIVGRAGAIPARGAELFGGNAGTTVRFLASLVALGHGRFRIDGDARMRERPIEDLLVALRALGVRAETERGNGCPPFIVDADGLRGGAASVAGGTSSQYASSILLAAPYARSDVRLRIVGELVGEPFVEMTIGMMGLSGVTVERSEEGLRVDAGQRYRARDMPIEPDATAASYFLAAAALVGGEVTVQRLGSGSLQGDLGFVDVLSEMGARVRADSSGTTVTGGALRGVDRDFRAISDTFLTAAALAPFASSPTVLRGIGHTRHQETDRVAAVARELRRLGVTVVEHADALEIHPGAVREGEVETYDDHRIAM
ncbi:MAG: 3-phosphoshikimate 1-carboxyvinyltransferase, partial [Candidatus Binatia bacterium]